MKISRIISLCIGISLSAGAYANSDDQTLLKSMHEYGITKCNSFVLENSRLKGNWNFFISKHVSSIAQGVSEVSITTIFGSKGDTVKTDDTYIQTPQNCLLNRRSTVTYPGTCDENVDKNFWYVSEPMPGRDYKQYKNKGGVVMFAKDIDVGNFSACVQETSLRKAAKHG